MQQLVLILLLVFSLLLPGAPSPARDTAPQASAPKAAAAQNATAEAPSREDTILTRLPNGLLVYILRDQRF
ncbi:MAG: hypothetical protein HDQ94_05310, partial [Desulfovibrio sp.]|nr:hypothetical protein [Desulfovibrio sp.]